jgi:hypothetical protein
MEFQKIVSVKTTLSQVHIKPSCKTGTSLTVKEQENLVNGLLLVKIPMSPFKTNLITMRVEDLDKNLHYEKYNRNGKAVINIMCVVLYRNTRSW